MPVRLSECGAWPHPPRLPLGGGWDGHCTAPGYVGAIPEHEHLHEGCNLGYAAACPKLPSERRWDAVRLGIAREERAQVILNFVCERDHRPVDYGRLRFDLSSSSWTEAHPDPRIQRMAECLLQAHLSRSGRATDLTTHRV